jgi:hypothetical protein
MSARPKLRRVQKGAWCGTSQKYLQWLDKSGSWRFRRVVPKDLRDTIGKTEWTETLKARNENEAIRLMQPHIAETDRIIALAGAGNWPPIPDEDVDLVFCAWKAAEPNLNKISSSDIQYSVERFLTGPRHLRFNIDLPNRRADASVGDALRHTHSRHRVLRSFRARRRLPAQPGCGDPAGPSVPPLPGCAGASKGFG